MKTAKDMVAATRFPRCACTHDSMMHVLLVRAGSTADLDADSGLMVAPGWAWDLINEVWPAYTVDEEYVVGILRQGPDSAELQAARVAAALIMSARR